MDLFILFVKFVVLCANLPCMCLFSKMTCHTRQVYDLFLFQICGLVTEGEEEVK